MAAGDFLTWAVQAQDAPAHVARILQTILLNEGVVDVAGGSFETTEDTGSNMNITVGSGTIGDLAVVEGDDTAGQGVYVIEAQNASVTKTIAASDPSDDRIDLVVLQNYDDEADSSGNNDAEVEVIEGTPAGSPSAPALPDSAIPLAEVTVGAGVTAITDANIADTRSEATLKEDVRLAGPLGVLDYATRETSGSSVTTEADLSGLSVTVDVPANRVIRISGLAHIQADSASDRSILRLYEDATQIQSLTTDHEQSGSAGRVIYTPLAIRTPAAGSVTYKFTLEAANGTVSLVGASGTANHIVVEDLGPA